MRSQSGDVQMTPLSSGPSEYAGSRAGADLLISPGSGFGRVATSLSSLPIWSLSMQQTCGEHRPLHGAVNTRTIDSRTGISSRNVMPAWQACDLAA